MKTLTIVRHAKSSWGDVSLDDHDRTLNQRGERVAPQMGEVLAARVGCPSVIISSTAIRARSTAGMIAEKVAYLEGDIIDEGQVYQATSGRLMQVLREIDESHESAMLFGHVPGVHELTNALCGGSAVAHFPTCAASLIELEIDYWGEIDAGAGKLVDFLVPKELLENA